MTDLKISSADTLDGKILLLELTNGTTLEFSLEQILTLTPMAILQRAEETDADLTGEVGRSDAN